MQEVHALALNVGQTIGAQILDGRQHERQRRAELVAHVAEEGGLGAVDLGELLGALALVLILACAADGGGHVVGGEREEGTVSLVERAMRAGRHLEHPVGAELQLEDVVVGAALERPCAGGGDESPLAVGVEQMEARVRDVRAIALQDAGRRSAGLLVVLGAGGLGCEMAQRRELAACVDLLGGLGDRREHAADARGHRLVGDRAVGDLEVRLLEKASPVDEELQVVARSGRLAAERRFDHGSDDVPDLRPALGSGLTHRARMLVAGDGPVRVVVKLHEARPPPEEEREAVAEQQPHHRAQRVRPARRRAQRCRGPVDRLHEGAHLAAVREQGSLRLRSHRVQARQYAIRG